MYEMNADAVDQVAGGWTISGVWSIFNAGMTAFGAWNQVMLGTGGTLSNYYGQETTLDIINGGNLGA